LYAQYRVVPVAVETLGAPGGEALAFFRELGQRFTAATAELRSYNFLCNVLA